MVIGIGDFRAESPAARRALAVVSVFLLVVFVVQIINSADHYRLVDEFGVRPRSVGRLPNVVLSCFVHLSWGHFFGNAVFLVVFGYLAAYQGILKFLGVTLVVMVTSNLPWWLYGPANVPAAGASGMIWGWTTYGLVRGCFHLKEMELPAILMVAVLYAASILDLVFPPSNTDWRAHVGGLVGGVVCGWVLRNRPATLTVDGGVPLGNQTTPMSVHHAFGLSRTTHASGNLHRAGQTERPTE